MTSVTRSAPLVAGCMLVIALAGCAANPGIGTVSRGAPDGVLDPLSESPTAVWVERGESFAIVTIGSSSCPAVATEVETDGTDLVSVTFGSSPNTPCTADMAPTTHQFDLPAEVTSDAISVKIRFEDWPEVYTIPLD
ncbi:hypothetical protein JNB63_17615 [Microbacterium trichothecenolyticum]|uniref:hypothetical protein n=1 Tax=Microbacterium trichothecenolyticum TaxID=69370 RepID=UPI001C6EF4DA|nr:hypothetical protein [Microbacterium trichothecenolyticum]MBW9121919.1 hypothetical protein [Microbacterium trichothecenolyticum]